MWGKKRLIFQVSDILNEFTYPLVNVYIAMERSTHFSWENPLLSTISMAIFSMSLFVSSLHADAMAMQPLGSQAKNGASGRYFRWLTHW